MLFFSIILIIGALTTFTDLKNKKIYNYHLILGAALGIMATAYTAVFKHEHVFFHIVNGLVAFLIGFLLHRSSLWRGGDAKLFALYAFLMPAPVYSHIFFPSVVNLFACSFIAGTIILLPVFIKDIIINHKIIVNDLLLPAKREALLLGFMRVIYYSWILFPFYYLARITNPVIILTIIYLFFSWRYTKDFVHIEEEAGKDYILDFLKRFFIPLSLGFIAGFLMRFLLSPSSLSCPALTRYIVMMTLSTTLSICIHTTFNHFKDYHERVPFAPLLFMGCILSYTPFLTGLIQQVTRWNVLFSR
jgi:Flp pilus assembly protein protease CpaA